MGKAVKKLLAVVVLVSRCWAGTWSHVGGGCNEATSVASQTITITGTVNAGDVIVAFPGCSVAGFPNPTVTTSLASTTFTRRQGPINAAAVGDAWSYTAVAGAGATNPTVTINFGVGNNCNFHEAFAEVFRSTVSIASAPTGLNNNSGTSTSPNVTITPATSTNLVYVGWVFDTGATISAGANYTLGCVAATTGNGVVYRLNSTGSQSASATLSNVDWLMLGMAWDEAGTSPSCSLRMSLLGAGCR